MYLFILDFAFFSPFFYANNSLEKSVHNKYMRFLCYDLRRWWFNAPAHVCARCGMWRIARKIMRTSFYLFKILRYLTWTMLIQLKQSENERELIKCLFDMGIAVCLIATLEQVIASMHELCKLEHMGWNDAAKLKCYRKKHICFLPRSYGRPFFLLFCPSTPCNSIPRILFVPVIFNPCSITIVASTFISIASNGNRVQPQWSHQ